MCLTHVEVFGYYVLSRKEESCTNMCMAECTKLSHNESTGFKHPCYLLKWEKLYLVV